MTIPDDKLKRFMNVVYNTWFYKWKGKIKKMSDDDWASCIDECKEIIKQGEGYPVVLEICKALLNELEKRYREVKDENIS